MNIVVVDAGHLAGEADFPEIDLPKYGWQQYVGLDADEVGERCWRSDVIVSVSTPIDKAILDKAFKLQLIVAAGDAYDHIDTDAAAARGIKVLNTPRLDPRNSADVERICQQVVDNINAHLHDEERNRVA